MTEEKPGRARTYRLRETRTVPLPIENVFTYTADFSNSEEWDPGVDSARQVGSGPVGVGSTYELVGSFGPSTIPMRYEVTEYEPPRRVVLHGRGDGFSAIDTIEFETLGDGSTEITYTARISISGPARFLGFLLDIPMTRMGRRAVDGLVDTLTR